MWFPMARKSNASVTPQLIAAPRVPDEYGFPYTTARDLVFRGELPVVKLGRAWYFRRSDLDALIDRLTQRVVA